MAKKHKKTPEEKAAVAIQKKQQRRARRKKETSDFRSIEQCSEILLNVRGQLLQTVTARL